MYLHPVGRCFTGYVTELRKGSVGIDGSELRAKRKMTMKGLVLVMSVITTMALSLEVSVFAADKTSPPEQVREGVVVSTPAKVNGASGVGSNGKQVTPIDQSSKKEDVEVTRQIRKGLVADSSLSVSARNVKIVTAKGVVTLSGVVKNQDEHDKVLMVAKKFMGANTIKDQIKVGSR